jgi:hypothetical protein
MSVREPHDRPLGKGNCRTAQMHVSEESDSGVILMNHSNNDGQSSAESEEGRPPDQGEHSSSQHALVPQQMSQPSCVVGIGLMPGNSFDLLIRPSFIPSRAIRELRDFTRRRKQMIGAAAESILRHHAALPIPRTCSCTQASPRQSTTKMSSEQIRVNALIAFTISSMCAPYCGRAAAEASAAPCVRLPSNE